jgi:hypothetical protein
MSQRELKRRHLISYVLKKAWKLYKNNYYINFSTALKLAWKIMKGSIGESYSKVRGVTFENRQQVIKRLLLYPLNKINLTIERDFHNLFDTNAIKVNASIIGKGSATIGYVSHSLATKFTKALDEGYQIYLYIMDITGDMTLSLGVNFSYFII